MWYVWILLWLIAVIITLLFWYALASANGRDDINDQVTSINEWKRKRKKL